MRKFTEESTTYFAKGLVCKWNVQKMRSESSEYVSKTTGFFTNSWRIKIALERPTLKQWANVVKFAEFQNIRTANIAKYMCPC